MAPMGWALKVLLRRPTVLTVHGKEATYAHPLYRLIVPPFVRRQTQLIAVSNETKKMVQHALPGTNPHVIFNGLNDSFYMPGTRDAQLVTVGLAIGKKLSELKKYKIIHTNGRLVRRKGVLWFIDNVLPELLAKQPVLYLVSGIGKDQEVIEAAIREHGLEQNVYMLGRVSNELLHSIYNAADVFVMPNIPVANDMEGFGLVASCGTMVIASKLEGIQDAIIDGKNGVLIEPLHVAEYVTVLNRELHKPSLNRMAVRDYTLRHYAWSKAAEEYEALMSRLVTGS
jgi:phosphatidylinositol alpha-1,6-mannosyltransferase